MSARSSYKNPEESNEKPSNHNRNISLIKDTDLKSIEDVFSILPHILSMLTLNGENCEYLQNKAEILN